MPADQLAYFAFDLLHLDGHDLRTCAIEDRQAPLRDTVGTSRSPSPVQPVPAGLVKFGLAGRICGSASTGCAPARRPGHGLG